MHGNSDHKSTSIGHINQGGSLAYNFFFKRNCVNRLTTTGKHIVSWRYATYFWKNYADLPYLYNAIVEVKTENFSYFLEFVNVRHVFHRPNIVSSSDEIRISAFN